MLSPTIAPSAATAITAQIEKCPREASTPAATSAVSPGTHTPADSRPTIRKRKASPYWSTMCSNRAPSLRAAELDDRDGGAWLRVDVEGAEPRPDRTWRATRCVHTEIRNGRSRRQSWKPCPALPTTRPRNVTGYCETTYRPCAG